MLALVRSKDSELESLNRERTVDKGGGMVPEVRVHILVSVNS